VEYGSYACPHCGVANERIGGVRTEFGDRLRYVFRHRPLTGNDLAPRAAELAEMPPCAGTALSAARRRDCGSSEVFSPPASPAVAAV
jgi:hypothetical protein